MDYRAFIRVTTTKSYTVNLKHNSETTEITNTTNKDSEVRKVDHKGDRRGYMQVIVCCEINGSKFKSF